MRTAAPALLLALAGLAAVLARPAASQSSAPPRGLRVELSSGVSFPAAELGRTGLLESAGFVDFGEAEPSALLAAAVLLDLDAAWRLRLGVARSLEAGVQGRWSCAPFVPCAAVLILADGRLRRSSAGLDVLFRPELEGLAVRPAVFAGVALRRQSVEWTPSPSAFTLPTSWADTDVALRLGVEAGRRVGPAEAFLAFAGTVAGSGAGEERVPEGVVPDGRVTNVDLSLTLGVRVRP